MVHVTTAHRANDVRIFERECRSLSANGFRVTVVAPGPPPPQRHGVEFIEIAAPPDQRMRRLVGASRRARRTLAAIDADLFHLHDPELVPMGFLLTRHGKRVVWDAHEDYVLQIRRGAAKEYVPSLLRRPTRLALSKLLRQAGRRFSGVVVATEEISESYPGAECVVVGNQARINDFIDCRPGPDTGNILFTGQVSHAHRFMNVVEAIAQVAGTSLLVAGHPPEPATWQAAKAILGSRLTHLGWLSRPALVDAIDRCSLGLATYSPSKAYETASPTKLFEFAAAGLPVVATPNEANRLVLGVSGAGVVATGYGSNDLRDALVKALSDPDEWTAMSTAGRRYAASEGSWKASEERLLDLYRRLLDINPVSQRVTSRN